VSEGTGEPLRVGMIGAGDMSHHHLLGWQRAPAATVVAIANRSVERARTRAAEFSIPAVYDDPARMLQDEALDAVDIVTNRGTHAEYVHLAARHGLDAMCQKPLAPSLQEARSLVKSVRGHIRLMVHENRRFAPHFRQARSWIAAGKIGEPRQTVMTTWRSSMLPDADGRRASVERAPYFATEERLMIGEALIHQLDVLRYLLGSLRVVAARTRRTEPDIPGETLATIMLETVPTGAPVVLAGSYVAPGFGNSTSSGSAVGAQTSDRLEVIGSRGSLVMTDSALELRGREPKRVPVDYVAAYQECFDVAIAHFVQCLRDGTPFETDAEDNLETLQLVDEAYRLATPDYTL
jgi:D-apiose dehydrogenase